MAVYVDNICILWRGKRWCHLLADSLLELHQFSELLGVTKKWFHKDASYPHYDITVEVRDKALRYGALLSDRATIINCAKQLKRELSNKEAHLKLERRSDNYVLFREQEDLFRQLESEVTVDLPTQECADSFSQAKFLSHA